MAAGRDRMRTMTNTPDLYAATVLRTLVAHAPCTKLCIKQHSGLSMSTVLRAVDVLTQAGWATLTLCDPPHGGKPHARLELGTRPVYGAMADDEGWRVCALTPGGQTTRLRLLSLDGLAPVCIATADTHGQDAACWAALHGGGAYLEEGRLHRADGEPLDMAGLPSPLWMGERLDYRDAYRLADEQQKIRLTAELTLWAHAFWRIDRIYRAGELRIDAAEAAAWRRMYALLHGYL